MSYNESQRFEAVDQCSRRPFVMGFVRHSHRILRSEVLRQVLSIDHGMSVYTMYMRKADKVFGIPM